MARVSSLDQDYTVGDLSNYPEERDTTDSLFEAKNNAKTALKNALTYSAKTIIVNDTSSFPSKGLIRVGPPSGTPGSPELIHYASKTATLFQNLTRGFAGSQQNMWSIGSEVSNAVHATHHNAVKDALLNVQSNLGIESVSPTTSDDDGPLNGILKEVENKFLTPRPVFRATSRTGPSPLTVKLQNFTDGDIIRYLWDFGDGSSSDEESPTHTYLQEGQYSVGLEVITSTGGTGIATKNNYIIVDDEKGLPFFYATPLAGVSMDTATQRTLDGTPTDPTSFEFVDQTDGDIVSRFWVFGDGENETVLDPDDHSTTHIYQSPGVYSPSLLAVFATQSFQNVLLQDTIVVV